MDDDVGRHESDKGWRLALKIQYKGLYFYVGRNGIIFELEFDFRGKHYCIESLPIFFCRFGVE
jgi:hypothetical protein